MVDAATGRTEQTTYRTRSAAETEALGRRLARLLCAPSVVLLRGSLGSGKTTLTRGLAQGLGVQDPDAVSSPSFTIVNLYEGRCPVYHVDLYRLEGRRDLASIGLEEFLGIRGVTIVEWGERLADDLTTALVVEILDCGGDMRRINVRRVSEKTARTAAHAGRGRKSTGRQ